MKKVIVSGNIDRDHLMSIDGLFKDSILPGRLNNLSVSFQPTEHDVFFGGAAANIAYNLKLLGGDPLLFSVVGKDYRVFFERLEELGISTDFLDVDEERVSSACYILNDGNKNQITFFSAGASLNSSLGMDLKGLTKDDTALMIISPNTPERMLEMSRAAVKAGIPYIFDPGQACSSLTAEIIDEMIFNALGLIVNDYEYNLLLKKVGKSVDDLLDNMDFVIKTKGLEGVDIFAKDAPLETVPAILMLNADPTGCGDAFRAGFILSYLNGDGLKRAAECGTATASFALEKRGTQSHRFSFEEYMERLNEHFPL
jgi:adenosine kinase